MPEPTVVPGPGFNEELGLLWRKWAPPGRASEFMSDITKVVMSAIQAGRSAAQGAQGIVICGRCNKVVHKCEQK